jgi:Uma2 family endonuclease
MVKATLTDERLITTDEFWTIVERPENADRRLELVYGVIVDDVTSGVFIHGHLMVQIVARLHPFVEAQQLGETVVSVDHYLPGDRFNTRRPDIEFNTWETLKRIDPAHPVPHMPDMAIEIKSPGNTKAELRQKAAYYLQHGTRLVWVVYIDERIVVVYTPNQPAGQIMRVGDTLDGGDLLPGFRLPLKDIFREG